VNALDAGQVKVGAHALIWAPGWSTPEAERVISGAADAGFDFVEIALAHPEQVDVPATRALLADHGLGSTCGLGLPASCHLPFAPRKAEAHLNRAVDAAAGLGSRYLTGGIYTHLGARTGNPPTEEELQTVAAVLKRVARRAADTGVTLGVENINRYETYLVNRVQDALDLIGRIDEPNVVAHLDTYHANIEEDGLGAPVLAAGPRLGYVHLSESSRGVPGTANVDFDALFGALAKVGYSGPLVVESFAPLSDELTATFALWRDPVGDPGAFARASRAWFDIMLTRYPLPASAF
jgi:D-psicose/D-tagatose/L-ribulose 3-epimerase